MESWLCFWAALDLSAGWCWLGPGRRFTCTGAGTRGRCAGTACAWWGREPETSCSAPTLSLTHSKCGSFSRWVIAPCGHLVRMHQCMRLGLLRKAMKQFKFPLLWLSTISLVKDSLVTFLRLMTIMWLMTFIWHIDGIQPRWNTSFPSCWCIRLLSPMELQAAASLEALVVFLPTSAYSAFW